MALIAIYSSWSRRICWIVYASNGSHAMKFLEKSKVPYARNMIRWRTFKPTVWQVKEFMTKPALIIPVIDKDGNVIGKKKITINTFNP